MDLEIEHRCQRNGKARAVRDQSSPSGVPSDDHHQCNSGTDHQNGAFVLRPGGQASGKPGKGQQARALAALGKIQQASGGEDIECQWYVRHLPGPFVDEHRDAPKHDQSEGSLSSPPDYSHRCDEQSRTTHCKQSALKHGHAGAVPSKFLPAGRDVHGEQ